MENKNEVPSQGDVIWIDLSRGNSQGHEQQGRRPVLVVSNDKFNYMCGGLVKVVPITTSPHEFPYRINLPEKFKVKGKLMIDQERTIDVINRNYKFYCHLPKEDVKQIIEVVLTCF